VAAFGTILMILLLVSSGSSPGCFVVSNHMIVTTQNFFNNKVLKVAQVALQFQAVTLVLVKTIFAV
jgi:hypothetical protein